MGLARSGRARPGSRSAARHGGLSVKRAGIEGSTATRDPNQLVTAGLLDAVGQTRGRYYTASQHLRRIGADARSDRTALVDPYPWLPARLRA